MNIKNLNGLTVLFAVILIVGFVQGYFSYDELKETETEEGIIKEYETKIIQNFDYADVNTIKDLILHEDELYFNYQTKELLYEHVLERLENQNFLDLFNEEEEVRKKFWEHHAVYKYDDLDETFFDKVRQFFFSNEQDDFEIEEEYEFTTTKIASVKEQKITTQGDKASTFILEGFSNKGSSIDEEGCLYTRDVPLCELDVDINWGDTRGLYGDKPVIRMSSLTNQVDISENFINNFADDFTLEFQGTENNPLKINYLGKEQYEVTGITRMDSEAVITRTGRNRMTGDFNDRYLLEQKSINVESGTFTMIKDDNPYLKFEENTKAKIFSGLENTCPNNNFRTCYESQGFQGSMLMEHGKVSTFDKEGERLLTTNVHLQSDPVFITDSTILSELENKGFAAGGRKFTSEQILGHSVPHTENYDYDDLPRILYASNDEERSTKYNNLHFKANDFKGSLNMNMNNNPENEERTFSLSNLNKDTKIELETGLSNPTIFDGERNIYSLGLLRSSPDGFGNTAVLDQEDISYINLRSYPKDQEHIRLSYDTDQEIPVDFRISFSEALMSGNNNFMHVANDFYGDMFHLEAVLKNKEGQYFDWASPELEQFYADYYAEQELIRQQELQQLTEIEQQMFFPDEE